MVALMILSNEEKEMVNRFNISPAILKKIDAYNRFERLDGPIKNLLMIAASVQLIFSKLNEIVQNPASLDDKVAGWVVEFYKMGLTPEQLGDACSMVKNQKFFPSFCEFVEKYIKFVDYEADFSLMNDELAARRRNDYDAQKQSILLYNVYLLLIKRVGSFEYQQMPTSQAFEAFKTAYDKLLVNINNGYQLVAIPEKPILIESKGRTAEEKAEAMRYIAEIKAGAASFKQKMKEMAS